jgi:ADP-heptose:LPS heptosyltransferase
VSTRAPYLINSPAGRAYVGVLDAFLRIVARNPSPQPSRTIERVLLGIGGHIGDAVIASSALRWLGIALPQARVGIAISSSARPVLEGHRLIDWIHTVDHWKFNRSAQSWQAKHRASLATQRQARSEIRAARYDAAVDLYPYYPNMSVLLWRAGVARRIGYTSGGGGPAYTNPVAWSGAREHMATHHQRLLRALGPDTSVPVAYDLPPLTSEIVARGERLLADRGIAPARYVVLHPGSGDARKDWPLPRWSALARQLTDAGAQIIVTGAGRRDATLAAAIRDSVPDTIDLCGATDLRVLRFVLRASAGFIAIDSAAAHLAAAEGARGVTIMSAMTNIDQWRPLSQRIAVLMETGSADEARDLYNRQVGQP